ncbi:MAG: AbrB/MazE/SpoVT family DNA-binding domain-containing protein [Bacilli bacterium]|nr:AbrB/MazE/SpoVT family DNA-binding domain-containing protein [Bacilli bacterium]
MKIGIVRRIDNLGRIVIPKEIRDTLRIKNGDSLEINIEGEIVTLKKYSELNNIIEIETIIANLLRETLKKDVLITNTDKYIIGTKHEYINKKITNELLEILENRQMIIQKSKDQNTLINPIIINGDVIGSIIIISKEEIEENQIKTVTLLSNFLIKYIE